MLFFCTCSTADDDGPDAGSVGVATCSAITRVADLPVELAEASGAVFSRATDGLIWTHNDSGTDPVLYGVDTLGAITRRVPVDIAADMSGIRDWEDIAVGPCATGQCLYIADVGDNAAARDVVRIIRIPEPDPQSNSTNDPGDDMQADAFYFRYPDGPRDAEALFILPDGRLNIVTKGRSGPVALFRYPGPLRGDTVTLEHVRDFTAGLVQLPDQVTGAAASPDGQRVAIRTYSWLYLYPVDRDGVPEGDGARVDLTPAGESQGEAVAWRGDGTLFLLGEKGFDGKAGALARLSCQ